MDKLTRRGFLGKLFAGTGLVAIGCLSGKDLFAGEKTSLPAKITEKPWQNDDMDFYYDCLHGGDEGMMKMAQKIETVIRRGVEFKNIARQCLMVDELPYPYNVPIYEKTEHKKVISWMAKSMDGDLGEIHNFYPGEWNQHSEKDDVILLPFEIATHMTKISAKDKSQATLDKINKSIQLCVDAFRNTEESLFVDLLGAASKEGLIKEAQPTPLRFWSRVFRNKIMTKLNNLYRTIEAKDMRVVRVIMNPKTFEYIKPYIEKEDLFDETNIREQKMYGLYGHIWTSDILCSKYIKEGEIYATPSGEYIGALPIRQDFCSLPTEDAKTRSHGFVTFEEMGMGLIYPEHAAKITL